MSFHTGLQCFYRCAPEFWDREEDYQIKIFLILLELPNLYYILHLHPRTDTHSSEIAIGR